MTKQSSKKKPSPAPKDWRGRATIPHQLSASELQDLQDAGERDNALDLGQALASLRARREERHATTGGSSGTDIARPRRVRRGPVVAVALAMTAAIAVIVLATSLRMQIAQAQDEAGAAAQELAAVSKAFEAGSARDLREHAAALAAHADSLSAATDGSLWDLACHLPLVSREAGCARGLAGALQCVSDEVVTPAAQATQGSDDLRLLSESRVNANLLVSLAGTLAAADGDVSQMSEDLAALPEPTSAQLAASLKEARAEAERLAGATKAAVALSPQLGTLLGETGGGTTYLVAMQDGASLRSTGGMLVCLGALSVSGGSMDLGEFVSVQSDYQRISSYLAPKVTSEEQELFGEDFGREPADYTRTPSVPRTCELLAGVYNAQAEERASYDEPAEHVDGVILLDGAALGRLVSLMGGTTLPDGTHLTEDNTQACLANETALIAGGSWRQGEVLTDASDAIARGFLEELGGVSPRELGQALAQANADGHAWLWLDDTEVADALEGLGADGALSADADAPELGVFLCDRNGGRIDGHLSCVTELGRPEEAGGKVTYQVTTTLTNDLTQGRVESLREQGVGSAFFGEHREGGYGSISCDLYLLAPAGGSLKGITATGDAGSNAVAADDEDEDAADDPLDLGETLPLYGTKAHQATVTVEPGQTVTLSYTVTCQADAAALALRQTPTM